jgi:hypothetical protein
MMVSDAGMSNPRDGLVSRFRRAFGSGGTVRSEPDKCRESMSKKLGCLQVRRIPEYDAAILSCSVTLQQIVEVRYKLHMGNGLQEESSLARYEELLWEAYQHANGRIRDYYFSMRQRAAVVLIERHGRHGNALYLDLFYPLEDLGQVTPDFESTLWTCVSQLQTIAELDLNFEGKEAVSLELYLIVIYLFVVLESQEALKRKRYRELLPRVNRALRWNRPSFRRTPSQEPPGTPKASTPDTSVARRINAKAIDDLVGDHIKTALEEANSHLRKLADKRDEFAKRAAQVVYLRWMFPGGLCILTLVATYMAAIVSIGRSHHWTSQHQMPWNLLAIAVSSGALGSTVSVVLRVASRPADIDYHAGRHIIRVAGFSRPIIGAVFGLVFYIFINAGLLQVLVPPPDVSRMHFVAAICFVAGFSERRAQDIIVRALPPSTRIEAGADQSLARRPEEGGAS